MSRVNEVLVHTLELAVKIAAQKTTGNGGITLILQAVLKAYKEGQAGSLAKHVAVWVGDRDTGGLVAP
jgi:hypothetical protein